MASGFYSKGTRAFVTIRANKAIHNVSGTQIAVGYGGEARDLTHSHEVCWNVISTNSASSPLLWAVSNSYEGQSYNSFIYRNTFIGGPSTIRFMGRDLYFADGNVIVNLRGSGGWNLSFISTLTEPNIVSSVLTDIVDSAGKLVGGSRTLYLGRRGHEVQ